MVLSNSRTAALSVRSAYSPFPSGWRIIRLGDIAEVNPRRPRLCVSSETPMTFLPMSAILENCQGINTRELRPYSMISSGYTYFEENDVLFSKITPCLQNGKHALATGLIGGFGFGTTEFHVARASSGLMASYLFRVLTQSHVIDRCERSFSGTAGQQRVQPEILNSLPLLLPPLPEQRAIAAILDSIDQTIEATDALISATEQLRDSLLHNLLTRGLPGRHTEWKQVPGLGTIPTDWEVVRLGDVAKVRNGTTPSRSKAEYWQNGSVPFVKTGQVNDVFIEVPNEFITPKAVTSAGAVVVSKGSVLIAMIGQGKTRGMTARLRIDAAINQNFAAVFEARGDFSFDYFFAWARQNYAAIRALGQGSNQDALNCALVEGMRVPLPPLPEQQAIAAFLESVDESIEKGRGAGEGLRLLKESASDALLTGRVRVTAKGN